MQLIINIDQTPLLFVLISKYKMNRKGEISIPVHEYRQTKGTFSVILGSSFLPIQLIFQRATNCCHPKYNFLKSFHVTHTANHCVNEEISLDLLRQIIVSHVIKNARRTRCGQKFSVIDMQCF